MPIYPRPANGWGQAAVNNDNGFGQAAGTATNGFGTIHQFSPPHPATDLVGLSLTQGFDFFLSGNDSEPINTANQLNATIASSVLTFDDLTGIDIATTIGTGVFSKSGNTIICDTSGTLQYLELDNGSKYTFTEGVNNGNDFRDSGGNDLHATPTNYTFTNGVSTPIEHGTQTALINSSRHYIFDTVSQIAKSETFDFLAGAVTFDFIGFATGGSTQRVVYEGKDTNGIAFLVVKRSDSTYAFTLGGSLLKAFTVPYVQNEVFRATVTILSSVDLAVVVEGKVVTETTFNYGVTLTNNNEIIGGRSAVSQPFNGLVISARGATTANDYNNGTKTTVMDMYVASEVGTTGIDTLGDSFTSPKLLNGYNFSTQDNHRLNILAVDYVSGNGFTIQGWFNPSSTELPQKIAGDGTSVIEINASGFLQWTYNAVSIVSTTKPNLVVGAWHRVVLRSLGAGSGEIMMGDPVTTPQSETIGAVGLETATGSDFKIGNDTNTFASDNGYLTQWSMHPFFLTDDQVVNDWNVTKGKLNSAGTFRTLFFNVFVHLGTAPKQLAIENHIRRANADFVGLSEVTQAIDGPIIEATYKKYGYRYFEYVNVASSLEVMFMSKAPISNAQEFIMSGRNPLYCEVNIGIAGTVGIVTLHDASWCTVLPCNTLPTELPEEPNAHDRMVQTYQTLQELIDIKAADSSLKGFILQGDWNDDYRHTQITTYNSAPPGGVSLPGYLSYPLDNAQFPLKPLDYYNGLININLSTDLAGSEDTIWTLDPNAAFTLAMRMDYIAYTDGVQLIDGEILNSEVDNNTQGITKYGNVLTFDDSRDASDHKMVIADFKI